jgi:tetratricopeptide (TPR) repeat protein
LTLLLAVSVVVGVLGVSLQWREAEAHSARATANFTLAHNGIREIHAQLLSERRLAHASFADFRRSLKRTVLDYYYELRRQNRSHGPIDQDIAHMCYELAHLSLAGGDHADAIELCQESIPQWTRIAAAAPDRAKPRLYLAQTYRILGLAEARSGRPFCEAIVRLERSADLLEALVEVYPADYGIRSALADAYSARASLERLSGDVAQSGKLIAAAVRQRRAALQISPQNRFLQRQMADGFYRLGVQHLVEKRYRRAEQNCSQAIDILTELFSSENPEPIVGICLARCWRLKGDIAELLKETAIAQERNRREADTLLRLSAMFPKNIMVQDALEVLRQSQVH